MKKSPIERHFAFLYPDDQEIQHLLDLAVFLLNPKEKQSAPITIAGPFEKARELPKETAFCQKMCVLEAGHFLSDRQNTVFLRVQSRDLENYWDKPDYPFNPHMTLYDGSDKYLAHSLLNGLNSMRLYFCFFVSKITHVRLIKGQGSLELMSKVDLSLLRPSIKLSLEDVFALETEERIWFALQAIKRAKYRAFKTEPDEAMRALS
ncbi:MAG: hypothetical protein RLN87_06550 [Parasphingopyxis sp.]|uniref:hypothetical protein n=1 Tax=Parasphingopyxis sp. TaxID=1920299 RepID=UPI0032ED36AB